MIPPDDPSQLTSKIPRPSQPPPDVPDDLARLEQNDPARLADLTPQKRNTYLYERTIASLEKQQIMFIEEKNKLYESQAMMQQQLNQLVPRHAALKQAYRDARATNGLTALLMVVGGTLVSVAGAITEAKWKAGLLWSGGATFISGFLFALQASIRNQPEDY